MTDRATTWSITINNPITADEENIHTARQKGWKVEGQKEMGAEGTPHYQLMVRTPQVRFSAVKKQFPRAHIEVARNSAALALYVHKDDTRVATLTNSDKYPSQAKVFDMFVAWIEDDHGLSSDPTNRAPGRKGGHLTWTPDQWAHKWETFVHDTISAGYYIEQIAVNPQTLAIIRRYGNAIVIRTQTARQTDTAKDSLASDYTHAALSEEDDIDTQAPTQGGTGDAHGAPSAP